MGEKKSGTTIFPDRESTRLQLLDEGFGLLERISIQLVVYPAPVLPVANDSGIAQHAQMKRQARLRCIERIRQVANATFPFPEKLDDLQSRFVRECMKQLDGALGSLMRGNRHTGQYINKTCYVKGRPQGRLIDIGLVAASLAVLASQK